MQKQTSRSVEQERDDFRIQAESACQERESLREELRLLKARMIKVPAFVMLASETTADGEHCIVRKPDSNISFPRQGSDIFCGFRAVPKPSQTEIDAVLSWCAAHSMVPHFDHGTHGFTMANV